MAHTVKFVKPDKVNSAKLEPGDVRSVSDSIYRRVTGSGTAEDHDVAEEVKAAPKSKAKKEE